MEVTDQQRRLLELCAIRVDGVSVDWSLIARQAQDPSGLDDLFRGIITEKSAAATRSRPVLTAGLQRVPALAERVSAELEAASGAGARLVTVFDRDYPANLRLIPSLTIDVTFPPATRPGGSQGGPQGAQPYTGGGSAALTRSYVA